MNYYGKRWTVEMVTLAKELWGKGYSATQVMAAVNREFSTTFSRNAMIGKLMRSGAPNKGTPGVASKVSSATPRKLKPKGFIVASAKRAVQKKVEVAEEPVLTLTKELDPATNVDLLHLEEDLCKWPVSDTLYCGSPVVMKRKPYCSIHTRQSGDRLRMARADYRQRRAKPSRGRYF